MIVVVARFVLSRAVSRETPQVPEKTGLMRARETSHRFECRLICVALIHPTVLTVHLVLHMQGSRRGRFAQSRLC